MYTLMRRNAVFQHSFFFCWSVGVHVPGSWGGGPEQGSAGTGVRIEITAVLFSLFIYNFLHLENNSQK